MLLAQARVLKIVVLFCSFISLHVATASIAQAQETAAFFKANCSSCHTIGGGRLTGPDLKGVVERAQEAGKDRNWLISFILDPPRVVNSGDSYAARLVQETPGNIVMTKIVGLDAERAGFLLDLIEAESLLEESQFKGSAVSSEPFTAQDVERGLALFTGTEKLKGGSAMCMSCHRMPGVGGLGGGNLGPDLARVYEEGEYTTGGRATLSAWLGAPATPTMQSLLKDKSLEADEIHALVALMENRAATSQPQPVGASMVSFAILGLMGAALILFVFDSLWKTRLRSVRRTLVEDSKI
jgi:mono/diheme cytochrome c family protein